MAVPTFLYYFVFICFHFFPFLTFCPCGLASPLTLNTNCRHSIFKSLTLTLPSILAIV
jgi:hypothetical protein